MSTTLVFVTALIVMLLGQATSFGSGTATAQFQKPVLPESGLTAERSRALQSELQRIDANKAAWVDAFLSEWARVLDLKTYDVRAELGPIAMRAPAWQLYGASLVGDFPTVVEVLRGRRGAGRYVNTIAEPERKVRPTRAPVNVADLVQPAGFGDAGDQLVYTPVAPCRVVDTRPGPSGPGARTGILPANAQRDFDLDSGASTSGQGGGPFPCPGLPASATTPGPSTSPSLAPTHPPAGSRPGASARPSPTPASSTGKRARAARSPTASRSPAAWRAPTTSPSKRSATRPTSSSMSWASTSRPSCSMPW